MVLVYLNPGGRADSCVFVISDHQASISALTGFTLSERWQSPSYEWFLQLLVVGRERCGARVGYPVLSLEPQGAGQELPGVGPQ